MDPIFDNDLSLARKRRALVQGPERFLEVRLAEDLAERLATVQRSFDKAAAIYCLTSHAADAIEASNKAADIVRLEADENFLDEHHKGIVATPETVPLEPHSLDLAVSLLTLHETNDIPGLLVQIRRALRPDGLFLAALAGAGTLQELRESLLQAEAETTGGATPHVSPFADVREMGGLLQRAGFALPVTDVDTIIVRYRGMDELMHDLRAMGATNTLLSRSRKPARRALFERAAEIYQERFSDTDGRIRATFNIIWLSGWAPHESQQKPLAPGSAEVSLSQVLTPEPESGSSATPSSSKLKKDKE